MDLEEDNVNISQAMLDFFESVDPSRASSLRREIPLHNTRDWHEQELEEAGQHEEYYEVKARQELKEAREAQ